MIHGVGVDLVSVPRFERFARDHRRRLPEMFTRQEIARGRERMAIAFAVKEAGLKALGGLAGWDLDWREIASPAVTSGSGEITLTGAVAAHAKRLGVASLTVSVSRWGTWALAAAIALERPQGAR